MARCTVRCIGHGLVGTLVVLVLSAVALAKYIFTR
jgi:hypothetical protein